MITQPEALRLADALDLYATGDAHQRDTEQAAAELRRLHAVNKELLEALKAISKANQLDYIPDWISLWTQADAAIAKAEECV